MVKIKTSDWDPIEMKVTTSRIQEYLSDNNGSGAVWVMSILYQIYRTGSTSFYIPSLWKKIGVGKLPDTVDLSEKEYLLGDDGFYVLYHKSHNKFGSHIVEYADQYNCKCFDFFDYEIIQEVFHALDHQKEIPHIPTYYATIYDRDDYLTDKHHLWKDYDPKMQDMYKALVDKN